MAFNVAVANDITATADTRTNSNLPAVSVTIGNNGRSNVSWDHKPSSDTEALTAAQQKYKQERDKRMRPEGLAQYMDTSRASKFAKFADDPWVDYTNPAGTALPEKCKILIVGAGFAGLSYAIRSLQAGFKLGDIRIVDTAGSFGGIWYWNRYPGLMCDVEASVYLTFLEEMEYIPKDRYASGHEIKNYVNALVEKYSLNQIATFSITATRMAWDQKSKSWTVSLIQKTGPEQGESTATLHSQYVCLATGLLSAPKLPSVPGIEGFNGPTFHTARWNYSVTGGSETKPELTSLHDKNVAIVGTGATGIQAVPQLAKYAKHLYIIQRTPSSVDWRGNHTIDPEVFKKTIASKKGWQLERIKNYNDFMNKSEPLPQENLINDAWTHIPSYSALLGTAATPYDGTPESIGKHVGLMHALDIPRSERIRARVDEMVEDKETAAKLKHWYAAWCKRPTFHDEYLPTFNRPNVTLLDTEGKGIGSAKANSLVVNNQEYPVDVLIWSTGFNARGMRDPAKLAQMEIIGRDGLNFSKEWKGGFTLHGITSRGFPNLFFPGPYEAGSGVAYTYVLDTLAHHAVRIIKAGEDKAAEVRETRPDDAQPVVIEPSAEAVQAWGDTIMAGAGLFASLVGCTPSYITQEGEVEKPKSMEEQMQAARGGPWSKGLNSFVDHIEQWRTDGMKGIEFQC